MFQMPPVSLTSTYQFRENKLVMVVGLIAGGGCEVG